MTRHICAISAAGVLLASSAWGAVAVAQTQAYQPGLGDLMLTLVQPRHAKLGIAGRERNWAYAAFMARDLEGTFEKIGKAVPKYRDFAVPDLFASTVKQPLDAAQQAIKASDAAGFDTAYGQLIAACNTCHQSTDHAFIVIQAPTASAFPNQDFRPLAK
jgi:hypothetical protein